MGADGFHDVVIENLSASPAWRSSHVSPADVKSLCRRWPKAVYSDDAEACEKKSSASVDFLVVCRSGHFVTMRQLFAPSVEWTSSWPWTFI